MINRIKGILFLDSAAFEEVEHDEKATGQALLIVIVSSILAAIGASSGPFFLSMASGITPFGHSPWLASLGTAVSLVLVFLLVAFWSTLAWLVWAAATYFIGTKIFHGEATYNEMLRVTGFAYAPLAFMLLRAIPCIGLFISFLVIVWALAAAFIGVREGLDLDFGRTLVTVAAGWFIYAIGMGILFSIFGLF